MPTFGHINFDQDYSYASKFLLLLHNNPQTPPIELRHADLLTCVHRFQDISDCQRYINDNRQKKVILFITDNQFRGWTTNINTIDNNLRELFIYCNTLRDRSNMKQWNGHYKNQIRKVFGNEELDYYLLYVGVDYVKNVCDQLHEDNGLRTKFVKDGQRILHALGNYFGEQATRLSQEAS